MSERKEKFTRGPWSVYNPTCKIGIRPGIEAKGLSIVMFGTALDNEGIKGSTPEEASANAALIAAAPDMYAALEKAIADYGKPGGPWNVPSEPGTWIYSAVSALAKARGES